MARAIAGLLTAQSLCKHEHSVSGNIRQFCFFCGFPLLIALELVRVWWLRLSILKAKYNLIEKLLRLLLLGNSTAMLLDDNGGHLMTSLDTFGPRWRLSIP